MDVMPPENDDFHVDMTFSGRDRNFGRPLAIAVAVVGVLLIVTTVTTNFAAYLLPMSDEYLQILVPVMADGTEPLGLRTLEHEIMEKTIVVRGTVQNRTDYPVSHIAVVVDMQDTTGRFSQTVEAPVEPMELASQGMGIFSGTATLQEKPAGYFVKFRIADGPFIPHKDDRLSTFGVTVQQPGK